MNSASYYYRQPPNKEAYALAERLRVVYAAEIIQFKGNSLKSTITIGIADSTHVGLAFPSLLAAADKALYLAKQQGRNRVATHSNTIQIVEPDAASLSSSPIM